MRANTLNFKDQQEGALATIGKYQSPGAINNLTAADYKHFLKGDWGSFASTIEKYYPLSKFVSGVEAAGLPAGAGVFKAIATVLTDAHFKCPTYQSAVSTARNGMAAWSYEFTHNNTCVWLDSLVLAKDNLAFIGAAHTAELPYVFNNLDFDYPKYNYTCSGTKAERKLSNEMISLWTAMAENGDPSTKALDWPDFKVTSSGKDTPGMVFGNSSIPGGIDFSACKLWAEISAVLDKSNSTASASSTPSSSGSGSSSGSSTGTTSPTSSAAFNAGVTMSPSLGGSIFLSAVLIGASILF